MIYRKFILASVVGLLFVMNAFSANRIVSLAPSLTKNIYLLKAQGKLVGCTSYCELATNDGKQVIGSAISVNLEKTLTLNPDLVLATTITNPETIKKLRMLGIEVVIYPSAKNYNDLCDQLLDFGDKIGAEKEALKVVSAEKEKVKELLKMVPSGAPKKVFFQIGANPVFTVLSNTFMNDFITMAGGVNIFKEFKRGTVSRETVVSRNPEVILVSDMGNIGIEEKKIWESFGEMEATKNRQIFIVNSDKSCSPTVADFTDVLNYIINSIYPK